MCMYDGAGYIYRGLQCVLCLGEQGVCGYTQGRYEREQLK